MTVGFPGTTTPGRGAHRIEHLRTGGNHGLLAIGGEHCVEIFQIEVPHQLFEDFGDLVLDLVIQHQLAAAESRHHLDRHVVGRGSQATAGDDEIHALIGHEPQLRLDVIGAVAADGDVCQLDTQFQEPVGDPRAIPVLDPSGEDLSAGDHDARACAHGHEPTHGKSATPSGGEVSRPAGASR